MSSGQMAGFPNPLALTIPLNATITTRQLTLPPPFRYAPFMPARPFQRARGQENRP